MTFARRLLVPGLLAIASCQLFDPLARGDLSAAVDPPDTTLYVGATMQVRALMLRGSAGYPSTHFSFGGGGSIVSVTADGQVTGRTVGRATVQAFRESIVGTGLVSVVPRGELALGRTSGAATAVDIAGVDGSAMVALAYAGQPGPGPAPAWLPDDQGLVFQYANPGGAGGTRLLRSTLVGDTTQLVPFGLDPRMARDGSWLYFHFSSTVFRVRPDGTALDTVAPGIEPDPSPDGVELAFIRIRTLYPDSVKLMARNLATGAERLVATDARRPRWSPAGDKLAFLRSSGFRSWEVWLVSADGSSVQALLPGHSVGLTCLDWSPDGEWLIVRGDTTLEVIRVDDGLVLPLGWAQDEFAAAWRP